ncbi:NAD(P)-dependent alcohol dehydrogenase [Thiomicrorhabdus sediminis]|uniref:NAD(P)-dependent alcohol dehydrogenase n=1 Tax=Thiomicrorhabdus sediminis TaxID=2580412 RepID=A0A4P9K742_9GAMM|nr:NAD(P)-dependent alcohol dehydrogenase [Thiomicrorhabdus sediminis]QCU90067.1 NAD(P)-dependent alcohol dehydrogenase [Thiomicrorhabdus sediminis]
MTKSIFEKSEALQPEAHELLVQVHAMSVMPDYCAQRSSQVSPPLSSLAKKTYCRKLYKLMGYDFSGVVIGRGKQVTNFQVGDQVFGISYQSNYDRLININEFDLVRHKPENLSYAEAAALPFGALNALYFIKAGQIQAGQKVLVYGADSAIGISALQLARAMQAEVTVVCQSRNAALLSFLGATVVLDIDEPIAPMLHDSFDVLLDVQSNHHYSRLCKLIKDDGRYIVAFYSWRTYFWHLWSLLIRQRSLISIKQRDAVNADDLLWVAHLAEQGKLIPVIDRLFDFSELSIAMEYIHQEPDIGSVVLQS